MLSRDITTVRICMSVCVHVCMHVSVARLGDSFSFFLRGKADHVTWNFICDSETCCFLASWLRQTVMGCSEWSGREPWMTPFSSLDAVD